MAKLYFRYGAMNSGKSLFLISTAYNFKSRGVNYIVLKPSTDTRNKHIKSRAFAEGIECIPIQPHTDIISTVLKYNIPELQWILVDEAQFLSDTHIDQLAQIVDFYNINVICYGLRTDFQTKLFPGSKRLFEVADTIEEMKATCECGGRASVNARIDKDGNIILHGAQVECGAEDKYITLCRRCFYKRLLKQKQNNPTTNNMQDLNKNTTYSQQDDLNYTTTCSDPSLNVAYVYEAQKDINYVQPIGESLNSMNDTAPWKCEECGALNSPQCDVCACCKAKRK